MANLIKHPVAVVISDVHVGDPTNKQLDDFDQDTEFARLLTEVIPREAAGPATLIINGDFIDFPQVLPELGQHKFGHRFGATREESEKKLRRVIAGHPLVFESLQSYLRKDGQVLILPGNHDIDLHWPSVFEILRQALGGFQPPQLSFVSSGEIDEQRVHIEHGNQYSFDNKFKRWNHPILTAPDGKERLERPWGTFFMDVIYNGLEQKHSFINQVHPKSLLAWIAVRSFRDDEHVPASVIGKLLLFFIQHGKRYLLGQLLGHQTQEAAPEEIEELLRSLGPGGSPQRLRAIAEEAMRSQEESPPEPSSGMLLLGGEEGQGGPEDGRDVGWLLGRNDDRGMGKRGRDLLRSGYVDVVVFGHTHAPVDGNQEPPGGESDPRRVFNTGSWMPAVLIEDGDQPRWEDLKSYPLINDIRYLVINLTPVPQARLQSLSTA